MTAVDLPDVVDLVDAPGRQVRRRVEHVMGMPISLALCGTHTDDDRADRAWAEVMASLRDADAVFSTYRHDSVVSRLNRGDLDLVDCPAEVHEVLELGERARLESGGAFDVNRLGDDGVWHLDPSGVVKGWAVQRASRALDRLDGTDWCLSAGGDMVVRTVVPGSPDWRIGIEDPHDPTRIVAVVPVRDGAVATSGSAHRGHHVVDARTGLTPRGLASVTVVASDLVGADIDATAAYALGLESLVWLRGRRGRTGVVVGTDGWVEAFVGEKTDQRG